jgi:hypothetical protein
MSRSGNTTSKTRFLIQSQSSWSEDHTVTTGHSQFHYLVEVLFGFGPDADLQAILKTLAPPFAVAFLLSRATLYGWMKKAHWRPPGFSALATSAMSAVILTAMYFSIYLTAVDQHRIASVYLIQLLLLLFTPILVMLTPLLVMYIIGAARHQRLASPILIVMATCACIVLQALWFNYWTT